MGFPPLNVAVHDHGGAAVRLAQALHRAGHRLVGGGPADLLLIDLDPPLFGYRELIDEYKSRGATVLIYPHGAGCPALVYDGLFEPYEHVDGNLVNSIGSAEALRRVEYPAPVHTIGWSMCDLLPFRPRGAVRRVLFGPTHPAADGSLAAHRRERNAEVYARLLEGGWQVTVRHLGSIEANGLWEADGVTFTPGGMDLGHAEIDAADVVVAGEGTFPFLSIARGVPTVIYGQVDSPMYGLPGEVPTPLRRRDRYAEYVRFPFDPEDGPLDEVLHAAAASDAPIAEWKRRWIGEPLDDAAFAATVERIVRGGRPPVLVDDTRARTVVAFADELHERPELLAAYARDVGPADDATLVLWGPGFAEDALLDLAQRTVAAAGLDEDALPDILLLPHPDLAGADAALAARAGAVLSEWPGAGRLGALPRLDLVTSVI